MITEHCLYLLIYTLSQIDKESSIKSSLNDGSPMSCFSSERGRVIHTTNISVSFYLDVSLRDFKMYPSFSAYQLLSTLLGLGFGGYVFSQCMLFQPTRHKKPGIDKSRKPVCLVVSLLGNVHFMKLLLLYAS